MPIYNINSTTENIDAIRYVENGVTVEISRVYTIDAGKTVLVFNRDDNKLLYLYNEGDECTDVTGGWDCYLTSSPNYNTKKESYIEMCLGKGKSDSLLIDTRKNVEYIGYKTLGIMYDYSGDNTVIDVDEWTDDASGISDIGDIQISPFGNSYGANIRLINGNNNIAYVDLEDYDVPNITRFWFGDRTGNINKTQNAILRIRKIWLNSSDNENIQKLKQVETLFKEAIDSYIDYNTTLSGVNELLNNVLTENGITDISFGLDWYNVINLETSIQDVVGLDLYMECNGLNRYSVLKYSLPPISDAASDVSVIIQDAINDMIVTNDTTQKDIQDMIDDTLNNNGITTFIATVGTIKKIEATIYYSGSITCNIGITLIRNNLTYKYCHIEKIIPLLS